MTVTGPTADEAAVINRHFNYLSDLCQRQIVVLAGRTTTNDNHVFGICILRAEDIDEAQRMVDGDPAVAEGVMTAALYPFRIALQATPTKATR